MNHDDLLSAYSFTTHCTYPTAPTSMIVTKTTTVWCNDFVTDLSDASPPDTAMSTWEDFSSLFFNVAFDPAASALGTITRKLTRTAKKDTPANFVDGLSQILLVNNCQESFGAKNRSRRKWKSPSKEDLGETHHGWKKFITPHEGKQRRALHKKTHTGAPITIELAT